MHDGAVIIRNGRIYAAGCHLPTTDRPDLPKELGTRHRAAIGLSEQSDAVVIAVSEETSNISIAYHGKLTRGFNSVSLRRELLSLLHVNGTDKKENEG
jgi:diadenylate cyclase